MDGLGLPVAIVAFVLVLVAFNKLAKLETKLAQLKAELAALRTSPPVAPETPYEPVAGTTDEDAERREIEQQIAAQVSSWATSPPAPEAETHPEPDQQPAPQPKGGRDMEQALASRWFVWIGGIAIAVGGLLFVKYAYDEGLISPLLQIILGLIAGIVLVMAGAAVRRKLLTDSEGQRSYVPAALSAAGLAVLFASVYAAHALYTLIAPTTAFVGLAVVALGALVLSRRQGPLIAALGLIGSYASPALVSTPDPDGWSFFPYLLVILVASFAVLRGRPWWWLGHAAIAGAVAWTGLWLMGGAYEPADLWPIGLFANLLGLVAFFGLKGRASLDEPEDARPASWDQPVIIGLSGLAAGAILLGLLVGESRHDHSALILFAAGMTILAVIGWRRQSLSFLAPAAGFLMFACLMAWNDAAFHAMTLDEHGIWTWSNTFGPQVTGFLRWMMLSAAAFTLAGIAGVLLRREATSWGLLGGGAAFLFIWGAWARADMLLADGSWAAVAGGFAVLLLAGTTAANRRAEEPAANLGVGLLAAGSAALLVMALDRLLDSLWLTLAIAALAAVHAFAAQVLKARLMGPIAAALGTLVAVRLFLSRELWLDDRSLAWGQHWVLYGYGVPVILLLLGAHALRRAAHPRSAAALEGLSLGLFMALVALELRVLISGSALYEEPQFLEMAAHILTWLGAAYGLMNRQRLYSSLIATWGARVLLALAAAAIVMSSLLGLNPVMTEAPVPGNLFLNALTLAYLAPAMVVALIGRRLHVIGWQALKPFAYGLSLLLLFVYVTLQTKRVFQGKIMMLESLSLAESYAYSAVWLVFALALFVAGLRFRQQPVRYAGLGVMVLVVLKVFLADMSNLEGLYRIASFVGLGLCLVGIGFLYQRFVQRPLESKSSIMKVNI